MLEKTSTSVKFLAFFTASKQGSTGLTVTVDVYDPAGTKIVDAGNASELAGGLYTYTLSSSNSSAGEYVAIFKTTDSSVDAQHVPSLWSLGRAGVENLDASVSTRSTLTTGDLPTVPSVTDIRTELAPELANLDAAVSSRLADADYTAPTSAPTVADIRAELATELGRIDASISSRLADADYVAPTTPPTAAEIATAVESSILNEGDGQAVLNAIVGAIGNSNVDEIALVAAIRSDLERTGGKLDSIPTTPAPSASTVAGAVRSELTTELSRIDQAISSRLASSSYTAPANSDITAIKAKTDNLPAAPAAASDIPSSDITAIKAKTDALNTERLANVPTVNILGTLLAQANS